jgi:CHAT domain-containing protein/tetratricopeptide (TPR) repeat protein
MVPSGAPDGSIPYVRAAFSAQDEVAELEVVQCAPVKADAELVNAEQLKGRLAVARRGGCSFQEKTERVERAGARGLVIVNSDNALLTAEAPGFSAGIPVVMIRAKDEAALLAVGSSLCMRPHLTNQEESEQMHAGPTAEQRSLARRLDRLQALNDWSGIVALEREAIALARNVREAHPFVASAIHCTLGHGFKGVGQYERALEQHAERKAMAEQLGDRAVAAAACGNLGNCYERMGQYARALELHAEHKAMAEELGDRAGVAAACNNFGNCYERMGQYARALELYRKYRAISEELGDRAGVARACANLGNCYFSTREYAQAFALHAEAKAMAEALGDRALVAAACCNLGNCYESMGEYAQALALHAEHKAMAEALGDRAGVARACGNLGNKHTRTGQYVRALELLTEQKEISEELGDREGVASACNNLGVTFEKMGHLPAAARALLQGIEEQKRVERDVGVHDDRRVSLFEEQQSTYMLLQSVLLGLGQPGWALGVAAQAKARALAHRLGGGSDAVENEAAAAESGAYAEVCGAWWAEVKEQARGQAAAAGGRTLRVLEYSLLAEPDRLAIFVLSGAGELLGSATVRTEKYRRDAVGRVVFEDGLARMDAYCGAQKLLAAARKGMNVRGRDAMASGDTEIARDADASDSTAKIPSQRGKVTCKVCLSKPCTCAADEARERALLRELYAALVAPVEEHLTGAEEVLIVPHKELFEVPWAALIDAHGHFLIERHVLRVAPSLRVAHQAAQRPGRRRPGHMVLVGNPLPTRLDPLPFAESEVNSVEGILHGAGLEVRQEHYFCSNSLPRATKGRVKRALQGAGWAHLALHGDMDTDSLVLAVPDSSDPDHAQPDLSMLEVQGSDEAADKREGVRLGEGGTVVLSACNTGRGEIKAEGVVGLARGFLLAGAAAAVVSLWSVDDGSTAALMEQMYRHLVLGCTVPQALRFAMLRLARRPAIDQPVSEQDVADGLQEAWKRPMHWAGFLVMGASTRLPRGDI